MRSIAWIASAATLGAALTGLVVLGGAGGAFAQGTMMGDSPRKVTTPRAAKPAARTKKRYYGSPAAVKTCGQFKYWSKGKCLDARTTPPSLK